MGRSSDWRWARLGIVCDRRRRSVASVTEVPLPPFQRQFTEPRDPDLRTELLVFERAVGAISGQWQASGAIVQPPDGQAEWVEGHIDPTFGDQEAGLIRDYVHDKSGGNGHSWEVAFLWIASAGDAPAIVSHLDEILKRDGHPLGITFGEPGHQLAETGSGTRVDLSVADMSPEDPAEAPASPLPFPVAEVLSWRLVSELVRRHPADLWVLRTYPYDFYDCLSVRRIQEPWSAPTIAVNRNGTHAKVDSFMSYPRGDASTIISWTDAITVGDPRDWLLRVERTAGLSPPPGALPPSTPSSLALRWIAQFLTIQLGSRRRWTAWTEADTPRDGGRDSYAQMPAVQEWVRTQKVGQSRYLVWFVGQRQSEQPHYALSAKGDLWSSNGDHSDLLALHRSAGSMVDLITRTAAGTLP